MYKLIITSAEKGIILLSAIGTDKLSLQKYGENWVESNSYTINTTVIQITDIERNNSYQATPFLHKKG